MAKLIIVVLALAFTALVTIASAHRATLIREGSSLYSKQQCNKQLQGQRFNQCQSYINSMSDIHWKCCLWDSNNECTLYCSRKMNKKGEQGVGMEECCNELKKVEEVCHCEAMHEVYRQAKEQQWIRQQSSGQVVQQIVQNLHNQCNLQVQQCRIPSSAAF